MNKIKNFSLLLFALPLLLTSCLKDNDEVFDESASERLQAALAETRTILRGAENGWVMDYYVGTDQVYGGYTFIVKFDSLTCTACSELTPQAETSFYKLTTDNGPVLTFDTYNTVLHELATPSAGNYEGSHADYEFQVVSATPELVLLRGRRTGSVMQMRPLKTTSTDYLQKVAQMQEGMLVASMDADLGGNNVTADIDLDGRQVSFYSTTDSTLVHDCAFTFTDEGIRLYSAVEAFGKTLFDFSYDAETKKFTSLDKQNPGIELQGRLPKDYVYYEQVPGDYVFTFQVSDGKGGYRNVPVDVTIEPDAEGTGFIMKGLGQGFDIKLGYDKSKGVLSLNTQIIAEISGGYLWMNAADFGGGGSLYPGISVCGMITKWNEDLDNPVLTWVTNGFEDMPTDSFCLWMTDTEGSSLGQYRESEYTYAGYPLMLFLQNITKKTPFPDVNK